MRGGCLDASTRGVCVTDSDRLAALETRVAALELLVASLRAAQSAGASPKGVATDRELDDPRWGDPVVRKDPPRYQGGSCVGLQYSRCPPEYLDELAGFLEWRADKEEQNEEKKKYARYSRLDARRARGWAARARSGWKPPPDPYAGQGIGASAAKPEDWGDDEIPFIHQRPDAFGRKDRRL